MRRLFLPVGDLTRLYHEFVTTRWTCVFVGHTLCAAGTPDAPVISPSGGSNAVVSRNAMMFWPFLPVGDSGQLCHGRLCSHFREVFVCNGVTLVWLLYEQMQTLQQNGDVAIRRDVWSRSASMCVAVCT